MIISGKDLSYLQGQNFDDGYELKLTNNRVMTRLDFLLDRCKGKNVLHIGCCDHKPLIKEKVEHHIWLQGLLEEVSDSCIGVDIDKDTIEYVREERFSNNVYWGDITDESIVNTIPQMYYDCVVMGEILEHVDNPVEFMNRFKNTLVKLNFPLDGEIIISVPNLYKMQRFGLRRSVEIINTDHRYWFSPYTLAKILIRGGVFPGEIFFVDQEFSNWYIDRGLNKCVPGLRKFLLKQKSYCSNGLIAIGKLGVVEKMTHGV